jgi:hypothetical protein
MDKAWVFLCRLAMWIYFHSRWYKIWNPIYRFLFERKYKKYSVKYSTGFKGIVQSLDMVEWKVDGFWQLFDAAAYPGKIQYIIDHGQAGFNKGVDCEDFSLYTTHVINEMVKAQIGSFKSEKGYKVKCAKMMSVAYRSSAGKIDAHSFCLIEYEDKSYAWMDYYFPNEGFRREADVARSVCRQYGGIMHTSFGWAIWDENFNLLKYSWE